MAYHLSDEIWISDMFHCHHTTHYSVVLEKSSLEYFKILTTSLNSSSVLKYKLSKLEKHHRVSYPQQVNCYT